MLPVPRVAETAQAPWQIGKKPDVTYAPPSSGEYRGGDSETSGWPSGQQFQPSASFNSNPYSYNPPNPYIRAPGGRGGPGINRSGGTCKRENPFEPRNVNSNVAAAPAAPVHGLVTPATPYQPRRPMSRSLDRSSYRKPNFHDLIKRQFETPVNEEYPEYDTPIARPSLEDPTTKLGVVYRADKQDVDPDEDEHGYLYPSDYPRPLDFPLPDERGQAPQMAQRFVQPHSDQRQYGMIDGDQSRDYSMVHVPEVRFNPYNLPPELNVLKLMQTINRDGIVVGNDSTWEDQKLEAERSSPKVVENDDVEEAGAVKEMNDSDHANGGFDSQEEKLPEKFQERRDLEDWGVHAEKLEVQQVSISTESLLVESSTESSILDLSNREYKLMA
ncbi:hypothetical protein WN55_11291 [Dufourea novaeangliae]|uniref:Uncharacterized protein n=1 Tax=Dufourea novaeangliae TaxID=178035 RepID=A0A154PBZ2_DUFNO|nr:hypothetical protein WN55_11291 [Dufourea novaeangliae]